jgi:Na+-driven multidrug efflux pump
MLILTPALLITMTDILVISLLAGLVCGLPGILLLHYRRQIPTEWVWLAIAVNFAVPVAGWFFTWYVLARDWRGSRRA